MMTKISRDCVIKLIARCRILFNNKTQLEDLVEEDLLEYSSFNEENIKGKVLEAISFFYQAVSNGYLSEIYETITGEKVEVIGEVYKLFQCPCCGYRTLTERYGYDICAYCNWEDEGMTKIDAQSSVNRGTIADYRKRIQENSNLYYREKWLGCRSFSTT